MTEKKYFTEKYVRCTCEKHQEVLVGMKHYKYANIFLFPAILFSIVALVFNVSKSWYMPVTATTLLLFLIFLPRSVYKGAKKVVLDAGHSEECAKRIGLLVTVYNGAHSDFRILDGEKYKL